MILESGHQMPGEESQMGFLNPLTSRIDRPE